MYGCCRVGVVSLIVEAGVPINGPTPFHTYRYKLIIGAAYKIKASHPCDLTSASLVHNIGYPFYD